MHSINFQFVARVIGQICLMEVVMMLLCLGVASIYHESLYPFIVTSLVFLCLGVGLLWFGKNLKTKRTSRREGMLAVSGTWLVLSLIAMIPMKLSGATPRLVNAFFECVSGFTTTGATILAEVEHLPHSILFFRSLMQWQGGIGIVVFTVALIPIFGGGASQIFHAESTGITNDRFLPRIADVAKRLCFIYFIETLSLAFLLWIGPMNLFEAVCHSMTCLSTGGFSTRNDGIASFNSSYIEYVLILYMYIGGLNLTLIYFFLTGKPKHLLKDEEFRWYNFFLFSMTIITIIWLCSQNFYGSLEETIRKSLFQVFTLGTSTGYLTEDITLWKPFFWMLALLLLFVNGCAGSTAGGLKISRFVVLIKNLYNEFRKQVHPHLLTPVLLNKKALSVSTVHQILAFCVSYSILIIFGATILVLDGHTFISGISLSCTSISNSGPAIGQYVYSVADAGDLSKWTLTFIMLAGRLEIFTFIGILTPHFWRK